MSRSRIVQGPRPISSVSIGKILHMFHSQFRRDIMHNLASGERDVGTLAAMQKRSPTSMSQELGNLWTCGFVECRRVGGRVIYWPTQQIHAACTAGILHLELAAMNADELVLNLHYPPLDSCLGIERNTE